MWKKKFLLAFFAILILFSVHLRCTEPELYVSKIIIEGLKTVEAEELIKGLKLPPEVVYETNLTAQITAALRSQLAAEGFYFPVIRQKDIIPTSKSFVTLVFQVTEGMRGIISEISFSGNRYFSESKLRQLLYLGNKPRHLSELPAIKNNILALYNSRGYLFTAVSMDTVAVVENQISAVIAISEGPKFTPEKYVFSGNKVTRPATLLKISGLAQSKLITPEVLNRAEANLRRKKFIQDCSIRPIDEKTISIEIKEARMSKIEAILGLTTNQKSRQQNLSGYVNLDFINLWGTDRSISLNWRSVSTNSSLVFRYRDSGLNAYPFAGDIAFQRFRRSDEWIRLKTELNIYYEGVAVKSGLNLYKEDLYPEPADTILSQTVYYKVGVLGEYFQTDNYYNPTKGSRLSGKYGLLFSREGNKSKRRPVTEIDVETYFPLTGRLIYSLGLHFREIGDRQALVHEQYKMGGFNSLRGYREDEFSSWRLGWINSEVRFILNMDSRLFILFDNGIYTQPNSNKLVYDLFGVGTGITIKTKIGFMTLSYALSIHNNRLAGLNSGKLHMGMVSTF